MNTLFGNELIKQDKVVSVNCLNNSKIIGIYFSGSHCPPCQKFTPILSDIYTKLKHLQKNNSPQLDRINSIYNNMEIVFILQIKIVIHLMNIIKKCHG